MLKSNSLPSDSDARTPNGIFVPLDPIEHFNEAEYLSLAKKTIEYYQTQNCAVSLGECPLET
ncbi:MAG: hypothetical protein BGO67_12700 [Alphaproteobacteria bacterium 41-28]|nr:MAG: hypothetical protein BGO67_12700 [Alphaproteobacteria bacterium 41-28]